MVDPSLTQEMIDAGSRAVAALDASHLHADAAFWLLTDDAGWRMVLSIPALQGERPLDAYGKVLRVLREHGVEIPTAELEVAKPTNLYVRLLRTAINLSGIGGVRFTGNVVNGYLIRDALIYRMEGGPTRPRAGTTRTPVAPATPGGKSGRRR